MASTQTWVEGNGTNASTFTDSRTEINFKNVDNSTTSYASSPITAGNNSFVKYQGIKFAGTWNSLSALTYKVSNNAPATGITIKGSVVTSGTTPATTPLGDANFSTSGLSANFNNSSTPYGTGTSSTTAGGTMYANFFRAQMQTTSAAAPGDTPQVTFTATWTES